MLETQYISIDTYAQYFEKYWRPYLILFHQFSGLMGTEHLEVALSYIFKQNCPWKSGQIYRYLKLELRMYFSLILATVFQQILIE